MRTLGASVGPLVVAFALICGARGIAGQTANEGSGERVANRLSQLIDETPAYTCQVSIERSARLPRKDKPYVRDQVQLRMATDATGERYAWPGQADFASAGALLAAQGEIGAQAGVTGWYRALRGLLGRAAVGTCSVAGRTGVQLQANVPWNASAYHVNAGAKRILVPYTATLCADAATLDPLQLELRVNSSSGDVESIVELIEYARTDVGGRAVIVPAERTVTVNRRDGGRSLAHTSYSDLTPGAPAATPAPKLARLEAGVEFEMKLDDRISFDGLAVGAPLTAHLRSAVHTPSVDAPKNALLHCRLARLEEHQVPGHFFVVGVELLTLETEHGAVALSARLVGPQLSYDRRPDEMMRHAGDPNMPPTWDARGLEIDTTSPDEPAGSFRVRTPKLNVPRGLTMIWQTR